MKRKIFLSQGVKRHIRKEKARIRQEVLNPEKQQELINDLYKKFGINLNSKKLKI